MDKTKQKNTEKTAMACFLLASAVNLITICKHWIIFDVDAIFFLGAWVEVGEPGKWSTECSWPQIVSISIHGIFHYIDKHILSFLQREATMAFVTSFRIDCQKQATQAV